jgi:Domain of unknown function (DUF4184)
VTRLTWGGESRTRVEIPQTLWQDGILPFTLAHPAAVLPLRRTKLVFSALIIGSMAPDYPYFLSLTDGIRWGHSWRGVFLFCLPAGLVLLWLFHATLKRPLVSLAPECMRKRISGESLTFRFSRLSRFLLVVTSLLLGTLTHIFWDGFTHQHGYFVKHWAWLSTPVTLHHRMPLYNALQFACSAAGVGLLVVLAAWWWYRAPVVANPVPATISPRLRWVILAVAVVIAGLAGTAARMHALIAGRALVWHVILVTWRAAAVEGAIVGIAALFAEWVLFSLAWQVVQLQRRREKPLDSVQRLDVPVER